MGVTGGDVGVEGNLGVTGTTRLDGGIIGPLVVTGDETVSGILTVQDTGGLEVYGNTTCYGYLTTNNTSHFYARLVVESTTGDPSPDPIALLVNASANILNNLNVGGLSTLDSATVTTTLTANQIITDELQLTGANNQCLTVAGDAVFNGNIIANHDFNVIGSHPTTLGGTLIVAGATILTGGITNDLAITGNETVSGTLNVAGGTTLAGGILGGLAVSGNETVSGTLTVADTTVMNGQTTIASKLVLNNGLSGTAVLSTGGTVTIMTSKALSSSLIFLQKTSGSGGAVYVSSISNASSFTINSTDSNDRSGVHWMIVNSS